jgi:hemolysin III
METALFDFARHTRAEPAFRNLLRILAMTIFKLKQRAAHSAHAIAGSVRWNYDRAELIADGVVHALGVFFGLIATTALIVLAGVFASAFEIASVSVYAAGLLAMLGFSAAYNLWPVSPRKWLLRRFDHSAIYILIAATYTPFFVQLKDRVFAMSLLTGVWSVAIVGIVLKLLWPGRFDRVSVGIYLAMGWSGLIAYNAGVDSLPQFALWFIVAGGALYTLGIIFHAWQRLRFQNVIWHSFVLLGAACHYTAVLDLVLA